MVQDHRFRTRVSGSGIHPPTLLHAPPDQQCWPTTRSPPPGLPSPTQLPCSSMPPAAISSPLGTTSSAAPSDPPHHHHHHLGLLSSLQPSQELSWHPIEQCCAMAGSPVLPIRAPSSPGAAPGGGDGGDAPPVRPVIDLAPSSQESMATTLVMAPLSQDDFADWLSQDPGAAPASPARSPPADADAAAAADAASASPPTSQEYPAHVAVAAPVPSGGAEGEPAPEAGAAPAGGDSPARGDSPSSTPLWETESDAGAAPASPAPAPSPADVPSPASVGGAEPIAPPPPNPPAGAEFAAGAAGAAPAPKRAAGKRCSRKVRRTIYKQTRVRGRPAPWARKTALTPDLIHVNRRGAAVSARVSQQATFRYASSALAKWNACVKEARQVLRLTTFVACGGPTPEGQQLLETVRAMRRVQGW